MRRLLLILAAAAVAAVVVIGLTQAASKERTGATPTRFDLRTAKRELARAPTPLARLYAQANRLLPGGRTEFTRRLASLRGHPVVINKWASWCGPCQAEFPVFQHVAAARGTRVAFVGVDGTDAQAAAAAFLRAHPLPYPSFTDPHESIARAIRAPANYPMTVFVDARGRTAYIHPGGYTSTAALDRDIDRYLGHA